MKIFEATSVVFQGDEVLADRIQVQKLYNVPKRTLAYNINKLKQAGKISGQKLALSSTKAGRFYEAEVYTLDEIITIGFWLRSEVALEFQKWAWKIITTELLETRKKVKAQQLQLDYFWDKEDIEDLYS